MRSFRFISVREITNRTAFAAALLIAATAQAQWRPEGAIQDQLALEDLATTGSVLMIAAHPDDENTALLAWLARGRHMRTAYLSLTRGEGGQNLLGPEQGDALGLIRTEELLDARRIDGAQQFFTRAIDFGFTKTADEALTRWGRERTLSDIVWVIRRFRPDVIILRFSGTPRDGHGQHQASAILGKEAFSAAADPKRFPEQLRDGVEPWQAQRLMWNMFGFTKEQREENDKAKGRITVDVGAWDPLLGVSYAELAAMSRSEHKSQGMGVPQHKGSQMESLITIAGDKATHDIFDGVDTGWNRVPGGSEVGEALSAALRDFRATDPAKAVPDLLRAKQALARLSGPIVERKRRDLDEAIALCAGLYADATAEEFALVPGSKVKLTATELDRGPMAAQAGPVSFSGPNAADPVAGAAAALKTNDPRNSEREIAIPANQPYSQPYWLRQPKQGDSYTVSDQKLIGLPENPPLITAEFTFTIEGQQVALERPVVYHWVDRLRGQLTRPIAVVPPAAIRVPEPTLIFPDSETKQATIQLQAVAEGGGPVALDAPNGWRVTPRDETCTLKTKGQEIPLS
ncbi:MAG TPA: PIG-L family deacetylase, partial [Bryobacteraceae bacterium]|nr:PIG-L family deacetylase [Bryobacteraceae bacterium]